MELASATPAELSLRLLDLESKYDEMKEQLSNLPYGNLASKLPELTVSLLTEGVEGTKDELQEMRDEMALAMRELKGAKAELFRANESHQVAKRTESELHRSIDQLTLEKKKLKEANQRLEGERKASLLLVNKLNARLEAEVKKTEELSGKYKSICAEYDKSVSILGPVLKRYTPAKPPKPTRPGSEE